MKPADALSDFVRAALAAGGDRPAMRAALESAGWSAAEIDEALDGFADAPGLPPVPRPRAYVSAREALAYGLLFVALGMVAWHVVQLGFAAADRLLPDVGDYPRGNAGVRWSVASLIAFLPLFLILNGRINRAAADDRARRRSLVRKWFASVTLLIASLTLLGDLVVTIHALLNGDLTLRFGAKAGLVALIGALVFAYYRDEMDG